MHTYIHIYTYMYYTHMHVSCAYTIPALAPSNATNLASWPQASQATRSDRSPRRWWQVWVLCIGDGMAQRHKVHVLCPNDFLVASLLGCLKESEVWAPVLYVADNGI